MAYGWKRQLEIKAERERKKQERERIKAEKEKQKIEEKKKERSKKLLKLRNARKYAKRKKALDEYRKLMGDEKGYFSIYLMKDGKRNKFFGRKLFKNAALELYHGLLKENKESVSFKKTLFKQNNEYVNHKYELVLVKKLSEDSDEDNVGRLRNEDGKFINNYLVDAPTHKILDKNEWFIEETFNVYGFDPQRDRKNYNYIYNNIILNKSSNTSIYTRLFIYSNKLIHHYDDDFDMVICKTPEQCEELYNTIEKMLDKKQHPSILFMGKTSGTTTQWILDEMEKKTGWNRQKCMYVRTNNGWQSS